MPKTKIDKMVDRFLSWPMPEGFSPDGGIKFNPRYYDHKQNERVRKPGDHFWPIGTNLLSADQARAMIEHMLRDE